MKRRLPTTIESGFVLATINFPPAEAEQNRHQPNAAQPGRSAAASQAAAIAARAQPSRRRLGLTATPPSSTANAPKPTAKRSDLCRNRRHQSLAVV